MLPLLLSAALAQEVITTVGAPLEVGRAATWARLFPQGDGSWLLFEGGGGNYTWLLMADDYTLTTDRNALADVGYLVDHSITRCPDGSWLHVASANLESPNDSAYIYHYNDRLELMAEGVLAERDPTYQHNDAPVLCVDGLWGSPFQPTDDAATVGYFDQVDEEMNRIAELPYPIVPGSTGTAMIEDPWTGQIVWLKSIGYDLAITIQWYDRSLNFIDWLNVDVVPEGSRAYWPQGVIRAGPYFFVSFVARDTSYDWSVDSGDIWVAVFDRNWTFLESVPATEYGGGSGAMRPGIAQQGDKLVVIFDVDVQPTLVELQLEGSALSPGAVAGPDRSGEVGVAVALDGSASEDIYEQDLSYSWSIASAPAGSSAALSGPSSVAPELVPDQPGTYSIALTVTAEDGRTDSDALELVVTGDPLPGDSGGEGGDGGEGADGADGSSSEGLAPEVDAGANQVVSPGERVQLSGAATDADSDEATLSYSWTLEERPSGSAAELSGAEGLEPNFVADQPGLYRLKLSVSDGGLSGEDEVLVSADEAAKGCGCQSAGGSAAGALGLALLALLRRATGRDRRAGPRIPPR